MVEKKGIGAPQMSLCETQAVWEVTPMNQIKRRKPYRAVIVKPEMSRSILDRTESEDLVVAIDVAKEKMVAAVVDKEHSVLATVKWHHPGQSALFYDLVGELAAERRVEVAMEPTGTYGDALRFQLSERGIAVFQVSPKLVHDARELYDGVPSSHDAKACGIISMLHLGKRSRPYGAMSASRRNMKAATATLYRYERQFIRERSQLEAMLARLWPGITEILNLGTKSLLSLLSEFGCPEAVMANAERSREILTQVSKHKLSEKRIEAVLKSAESGHGETPCLVEVTAVRLLAADALRSRLSVAQAKKQLTLLAAGDEAAKPLIPVIGKVSAGALIAEVGDLREYDSPASLLRCVGLNLKECSSGQFKGKLRITKRGAPRARHYLFYAALRLIYRDPVVRAWHAKKRRRSSESGLLAVVAVMRKLTSALWHVARGAKFDASKLYDTSRLRINADRVLPKPRFGVEEQGFVDAAILG
jgi:transposase